MKALATLMFALALILLLLSGCDLARPAVEIRSYMPPPSPPSGARIDARAGRFDVDAAFAGKPLVWRLSETRYEYDFYNELLSSPRELLIDRTERWFGLRAPSENYAVGPPTRYVLEAHVDELYGDMRSRPGHAVLQVRYVLSASGPEPKIVFERTYSERAPMSGTTPESLVTAYGVAIDRVLARLQGDVAALKP